MFFWRGDRMLRRQFRPLSRCGARYGAGGDTKTMKSRPTIALPDLCGRALVTRRAQQDAERRAAGEQWHETGLVFTTRLGTATDAANVRRDFRRALALVPEEWTHSFVSLLSDAGVPIEDVSRLVGHSSTSVTELVYRHQIRPVIQSGATIMDRLFGSPADRRAAKAVAADNGVESKARAQVGAAPSRQRVKFRYALDR